MNDKKIKCYICDYDIPELLETHHLIPTFSLKRFQWIKENYIIKLCPTCHALIHKLVYNKHRISNESLLKIPINTLKNIDKLSNLVQEILYVNINK